MQWSAHIPTRFHVPRRTLDTTRVQHRFGYGTITLYRLPSQVILLPCYISHRGPNPTTSGGLGSSPFARRYLGNRYIIFLFL